MKLLIGETWFPQLRGNRGPRPRRILGVGGGRVRYCDVIDGGVPVRWSNCSVAAFKAWISRWGARI